MCAAVGAFFSDGEWVTVIEEVVNRGVVYKDIVMAIDSERSLGFCCNSIVGKLSWPKVFLEVFSIERDCLLTRIRSIDFINSL